MGVEQQCSWGTQIKNLNNSSALIKVCFAIILGSILWTIS